MSQRYHMAPYPVWESEREQQDLDLLLKAAKTGAVVGATGAAAINLHRMRRNEIDLQAALSDTVKAGFNTAVATGAATAVGRMMGGNSWLNLAATLVAGTAVMYALTERSERAETEEKVHE